MAWPRSRSTGRRSSTPSTRRCSPPCAPELDAVAADDGGPLCRAHRCRALVLRRPRPRLDRRGRAPRVAALRPRDRRRPRAAAAADDRQAPRPLLHRRPRAGAGLRPARRRVDDDARRHPRPVGPGAGVGDVDPPARAGRPGGRQGADVHQPADRRGRRRRPSVSSTGSSPTTSSTPPSTRWPPRSPPTRRAPTASSRRLLRDRLTTTHDAALLHERSLPYGLPDDMAERMARPRR